MKIEWWIDDGYVNRRPNFKLEIPDESLEGLSEAEQDRVIDEYVENERANRIGVGWKRVAT